MNINWQRTRDITISVVCIGLIFWAIWDISGQFVDIIVITLLSMAVAFLISPAVDFLARYYVPRPLGALLVYVVVLTVMGWIAYELVFSLVQQAQSFSDIIIKFVNAVPDKFSQFIKFLVTQGGIPES